MNTKVAALFASLLIHVSLVGVYLLAFETKEKLIESKAKASSVSLSMFEAPKIKPAEPVIKPSTSMTPESKPLPVKPIKKKPVKKNKPQKKKPKPVVQKMTRAKSEASIPTSIVKPEVKNEKSKLVETPLQQPIQSVLVKQPDNLSDADRKGIEDEYRNAVRQAILENRVYPRQARRKHQQGTSVVAFRLQKNGIIERLRLITSSGSELLDRAALQAVGNVRRLKPFPKEMTRQYWDFEIPISFKLS